MHQSGQDSEQAVVFVQRAIAPELRKRAGISLQSGVDLFRSTGVLAGGDFRQVHFSRP